MSVDARLLVISECELVVSKIAVVHLVPSLTHSHNLLLSDLLNQSIFLVPLTNYEGIELQLRFFSLTCKTLRNTATKDNGTNGDCKKEISLSDGK